MKILVVAATKMEVEPFINSNDNADVLITGVGAPACMYALTKQLQLKKYDFVIQAGIAGTFKSSIPAGETFIVAKDVFADLGIFEQQAFFTLFEKGFAAPDKLPYKNQWLQNESGNNFSLTPVNAITVNTVTDNYEHSAIFTKKFNPDIESMEGAAFHYVCISEGVQFIQLRSISNFVGERIKTNWKIKESIENLNFHLQRVIVEIETINN